MVAIIRRINTLLKGGPGHPASPTKPHGGQHQQQPQSPSFSPTKSEPSQAEVSGDTVSMLVYYYTLIQNYRMFHFKNLSNNDSILNITMS